MVKLKRRLLAAEIFENQGGRLHHEVAQPAIL